MAGIETMIHHQDILQGVRFTWKGLSGRQARWMERLSEFDFEVLYVPGENVLPDALSRMYEFDAPGTIQSHKEYLQCDLDIGSVDLMPPTGLISVSLLVGQEAITSNVQHSHRLADNKTETFEGKTNALRWRGEDIPPAGPVKSVSPESVAHKEHGGGQAPPVSSAQGCGEGPSSPPVSSAQGWDRGGCRPWIPPPLAESERHETGAEFAARMKDKFVLRGPHE
ncbi:hypothetical protein SCLCIDRAFT_12000 [Scleroderma citrinum Foug A]|uniref:Reverse transcriptase RNase H-like domain-containing protein n=1 Tax=Scleroderma citrinum Foug A TaxID=1036808 RepID=A0A0C2YQG5_9AGAM|nr:hypothetical protein SCLCIDRAFT_12000 [Scleroderma citrinum Foug A]